MVDENSRYGPEFANGTERNDMSLAFVKNAIEQRNILESIATRFTDKKLMVKLGAKIYGEIALEDFEFKFCDNKSQTFPANKVGKRVKFIPLSIKQNDDGEYIVKCSRAAAQEECYNNYIKKLVPGDIVKARVLGVVNYGLFIDVGCGITAIINIKDMSVLHSVDPFEEYSDMKNIYAVFSGIDKFGRLIFSHKELLGTWEQEASKFNKQDVVLGEVIKVEDFGVFVKISQNLAGLANKKEGVELHEGDQVSVVVRDIISQSMKVKLTIIDKVEKTDRIFKKFKYYKSSGHMEEWTYSTPESNKEIKTIFK